jgi:hypothetical protein
MRDTTTDLLSRIESVELELGRLSALAIREPAGADTATIPTSTEHIGGEPSSRRDLLRYGAVAVGAAAAAMAGSPAEALDGGAVIIGSSNVGTERTTLVTTTGAWAFAGIGTAFGLIGQSPLVGVYGQTSSAAGVPNAGVYGASITSTSEAPGVYGVSASPNAPAVYGRNETGGNAVRAEVPAAATTSAIALYALNYSKYTGGGPGAGGFAIYGLSAKGHGLVGATAAAGAAAVVGATNGVAGAYAAAFYGPVIVGGNFTVVGGAKSAAVPHPDGSHRRLYCMESPESWFEDFGEGALVCGEAWIALDPDFAAVVDTSKYHVFLTGQDGRCDVSVAEKTPTGFRVRAATGGEGIFAWRVVAKRKDIAGPRFDTVEIPKEPTLPDVPDSVYREAPKAPDFHRPMAGAAPGTKRRP